MSDPARRTVLIVDDEADVIVYLKTLFENEGFRALTAVNGKEGFALAKSELPDLITLDITMPEESGVRMFRDLQQDHETTAIPVVIVTGISHDFKRFIETRRHLRPPQAYFEKPIDCDQLLARVKEIMATSGT